MAEQESLEVIFKVGPSSDARKVGSAIAHSIDEGKIIVLRAVGAGAISQAQKGVAIANQWTGPRGIRLGTIPGFLDVEGRDGGTISALSFRIVKT